jgi:hypothetical protein
MQTQTTQTLKEERGIELTQAEIYARTFWSNRRRNDKLTQLDPAMDINTTSERLAAKGLTDRIRLTFENTIPSRLEKGEAFRRAIALGMLVDIVTSHELLFYFNPLSPMHRAFVTDHGGQQKRHRKPVSEESRAARLAGLAKARAARWSDGLKSPKLAIDSKTLTVGA